MVKLSIVNHAGDITDYVEFFPIDECGEESSEQITIRIGDTEAVVYSEDFFEIVDGLAAIQAEMRKRIEKY